MGMLESCIKWEKSAENAVSWKSSEQVVMRIWFLIISFTAIRLIRVLPFDVGFISELLDHTKGLLT
jgi:hypothetical protein